MIFNGNFAFFFHFLSICHVIQWEFYIFLSFHQFSMLFNGKYAFFCFFVNFPCYSMGSLHFDNFPCYPMGIWGLESFGGGQKDGRKDGHMEIHPCVLQDIGPLGPLPKKDLNYAFNGCFKEKRIQSPNCIHNLSHWCQTVFQPFQGLKFQGYARTTWTCKSRKG